MDDLISRKAAIDALGWGNEWEAMGFTLIDKEDSIHQIKALPSAEPEIIRCKDCLIHGVCRFEHGLGLDGYCSQAERRTDG